MTSVGLIVHAGRGPALDAGKSLVAWLRELGVVTRGLRGEGIDADQLVDADAFAHGLDLAVSVGGDGTFLRAAGIVGPAGCPLLGVKVGRMGFLTEVEPDDAPDVVRRVLEGSARIEERMAVMAGSAGGATFEPQWALNEIMVEKLARHRLVRLAMEVDDTYVTTFSADGVIVATPTGSTAYSFSARGPIVSPNLDCLVVTPVAAHMVFDRSFVLAPEANVILEVVGEVAGLVAADGREAIELPVGARVRIGIAPSPARLVRRADSPGFLSLVREKFGLPDSREAGVAHEPDDARLGG